MFGAAEEEHRRENTHSSLFQRNFVNEVGFFTVCPGWVEPSKRKRKTQNYTMNNFKIKYRDSISVENKHNNYNNEVIDVDE